MTLKLPAQPTRPKTPWRPLQAVSAEYVIRRLEEAGRTLMALPVGRVESYLGGAVQGTPARRDSPPGYQIDRMDEALAWIGLIPPDKIVMRKLVGARSMVHPTTDKHMVTWRKLGEMIGADHRAAQRWHGQAIGIICIALSRPDAKVSDRTRREMAESIAPPAPSAPMGHSLSARFG
jgi:hypothetical protein